MNPAKVVIREMQGQSRFQIIPLLGAGVGESGEPLAPLAKCAVLPLDMGRAGAVQIRISADGILLHGNKPAWAIAFTPFLEVVGEWLHHVAMACAIVQAGVDRALVGREGIRADLKMTGRCCSPDLGNEVFRVDPIPLA